MRSIVLPVPPSANRLFVNTGRWGKRTRSREYHHWNRDCLFELRYEHPKPAGIKHCEIVVTARINWKRDLDNIVKPLLDLLQDAGEIEDDRYVCRIKISRCAETDRDKVKLSWRAVPPPY